MTSHGCDHLKNDLNYLGQVVFRIIQRAFNAFQTPKRFFRINQLTFKTFRNPRRFDRGRARARAPRLADPFSSIASRW